MGEIDRLDDFLKYQQAGDATHFLFCWARHQQYRSELHAFKHFRDEIDVGVDVKVAGSIQVLVDDDTASVPNSGSVRAGTGSVSPRKMIGSLGRSSSAVSSSSLRPRLVSSDC